LCRYEVSVIRPDPNFSISPLRGIVPPNSTAPITVTFLPGMYGTFLTELSVNVSQFNFTPIITTITGSSHPGLHRQRQLEASAERLEIDLGPNMGAPVAQSEALGHTYGAHGASKQATLKQKALALETYDRGVPAAGVRGKGSGAAMDAGATWYVEDAYGRPLWEKRASEGVGGGVSEASATKECPSAAEAGC
jgi:hypothetical protein